jgi:hypothetical protein
VTWLEHVLMDFVAAGYYQNNIRSSIKEISFACFYSESPALIRDYMSWSLSATVLENDKELSNQAVYQVLNQFPVLHNYFLANIRLSFSSEGFKHELLSKMEDLQLCLFHHHGQNTGCYAKGLTIKDFTRTWFKRDRHNPPAVKGSMTENKNENTVPNCGEDVDNKLKSYEDKNGKNGKNCENDEGSTLSCFHIRPENHTTVHLRSTNNPFFRTRDVVEPTSNIRDCRFEGTAIASSARTCETSSVEPPYIELSSSDSEGNTDQVGNSIVTKSVGAEATFAEDSFFIEDIKDGSRCNLLPPPPTREAPKPPQAKGRTPRLASVSTGYHARIRAEAGLTPDCAAKAPENWCVPARQPVSTVHGPTSSSHSSVETSNVAFSYSSITQTGLIAGPGTRKITAEINIAADRAETDFIYPGPLSSLSSVAQGQHAITSGPGTPKVTAHPGISPAQRDTKNTHLAQLSPSLGGETLYQSPERRYQASQIGYDQIHEDFMDGTPNHALFEVKDNSTFGLTRHYQDFSQNVQNNEASSEHPPPLQENETLSAVASHADGSSGAQTGAPSTPVKKGPFGKLLSGLSRLKQEARAELNDPTMASFANFGGGYCPASAAPAPSVRKALAPQPSLAKIASAATEQNSASEESTQSRASQPGSVTSVQVATVAERGLGCQAGNSNTSEGSIRQQQKADCFDATQHITTTQQITPHQIGYRNFSTDAQQGFMDEDILRPHMENDIFDDVYSASPGPVVRSKGAQNWATEIDLRAGRGYETFLANQTSPIRPSKEAPIPADSDPLMNAGPGPAINPLSCAASHFNDNSGVNQNTRYGLFPTVATYGHDERVYRGVNLDDDRAELPQPSYPTPSAPSLGMYGHDERVYEDISVAVQRPAPPQPLFSATSRPSYSSVPPSYSAPQPPQSAASQYRNHNNPSGSGGSDQSSHYKLPPPVYAAARYDESRAPPSTSNGFDSGHANFAAPARNHYDQNTNSDPYANMTTFGGRRVQRRH